MILKERKRQRKKCGFFTLLGEKFYTGETLLHTVRKTIKENIE
jgi:hypothetical protein